MSSLPNRAELDIQTGEGHPKTIGFTLSMIAGDDGPAGAAIFFKDLTQIEHKEEQERLKDRLAALGQMAASLAHEIRNPLASIDVSCALLGRKLADDAEARELLSKIAAEIQRLNQTITSSLEFVKPVAPTLACSDLASVLREAIDIARERRARPGVAISLEVSDEIPPFLMDRQQMRQVFENLVLNAIEAVGTSGEVSVEAESIPAPTSTSIPYRPGVESHSDPWGEFDRFRRDPRRRRRRRDPRVRPRPGLLPFLHHQETRLRSRTADGPEDREQPSGSDRRGPRTTGRRPADGSPSHGPAASGGLRSHEEATCRRRRADPA